jgi:glycosyltransferase involved in cell wall biosynthesis
MDICTIVAKNYLAHARVLARSHADHHPGARTWVLVIDDFDGLIVREDEPFELVTPAEAGIPTFDRMVCLYSILELSTAVKPSFLQYLMDERGLERVAYVDPDIRVHGDLSEIGRLLGEHTMVVTPHLTEPMPRDGRRPSETELLMSGSFNLGFLGLRRGEGSRRLLEWWAERLERDCIVDPEAGLFVDQRWMDFSPGLVDSFHVLRDPGYNVAYWNLATRELTRDGDGWRVNGEPLRFFHFSGYDPDHRERLSKHQDRVEMGPGSELRRICDAYGDELTANGYDEVKSWPYSWGELPNGVPVDYAVRAGYRQGVEQGALLEPPFSEQGARVLVDWLNGPADEGGSQGVTRYLAAYRDGRKDLVHDFPDLDGIGGGRLVAWAEVYGRGQIPDALLPGAAGGAGETAPLHAGVNMAGYFRSVLGVGEHARLILAGLQAAGIPVATIGLVASGTEQLDGPHAGGEAGDAPHAINLVSVNADVLPAFALQMGHAFFQNRYTIGLWAWEVTPFPERYLEAFEHVDEVWVLSEHVRDAIQPLSPVPVLTVPLPIELQPFEPRTRAELGVPEGFLFLFAFDYDSVVERKNPVGLIEAFEQAFEPGSGASLAIKTINGDRHPAARARVESAAAAHPDVHVLDTVLSREDKDALIDSCDCYVSLHRAEGFGITLAEAMWLGKPAIATGFSGNLDFMTADNSFLVDWRPAEIGSGNDPYPPDGEWAEPDRDHAASLMREVFEHPERARAVGALGQRDVRARRSPEAAGRELARRLVRVQSFTGATTARSRRIADTTRVARQIAEGPTQGAPPSRVARVKAAARRMLLRLIKPYAVHQQRVDNEMLTAIHTLDRALQSLAASQARLERRLGAETDDDGQEPVEAATAMPDRESR